MTLGFEEFDVAAARRPGLIDRHVLRAAGPSPFAAPVFLHGYEPDSMRPMLSMDLFPVASRVLHDVCVGAESTIVANGMVLGSEECGLAASWTHVRALERTEQAWGRPTLRARSAVLLTGPGHHVFGHWLVDFLPRLFVLYQAGLDIFAQLYLIPSDTPMWALNLLDLVGISRASLLLYDCNTDVVAVEELIAPNNLRTHSRIHPEMASAAAFIAALILRTTRIPASAERRVLLVRRGASGAHRLLRNREAVERAAIAAGFSPLDPASLSLPDQVGLFRHAQQIIGEYGSALHLSLFSPPGTVVGCIRSTGAHPGWVQSGLGQTLGHPTGYVIGPEEGSDGTFSVLEAQVEAAIADMAALAGAHG